MRRKKQLTSHNIFCRYDAFLLGLELTLSSVNFLFFCLSSSTNSKIQFWVWVLAFIPDVTLH